MPVILCTWRRPERLPATLRFLSEQSGCSIKLLIWNNGRSARGPIEHAVRECTDLDVQLVHSSRNIGGFGRFYLARTVAARCPFVVFLDDDQTGASDFIASLVSEFEPETARGPWGFRFSGEHHYAARVAADPGQRVHYCGTGGLLCDTGIFSDAGLFKCPRRFWFVEDLWLSYYIDHIRGWPIYRSLSELRQAEDDKDQFLLLHQTKDRLFRYLMRKGWDPYGNAAPRGSGS